MGDSVEIEIPDNILQNEFGNNFSRSSGCERLSKTKKQVYTWESTEKYTVMRLHFRSSEEYSFIAITLRSILTCCGSIY